jgi:hypothetical protein
MKEQKMMLVHDLERLIAQCGTEESIVSPFLAALTVVETHRSFENRKE